MSSDQNQKGQLALKTPAVLPANPAPSMTPADLPELKVLLQGNLQLLNGAMEKNDGKDSPFSAKIGNLIKQVKSGNQSNINQITDAIYKLRDEMSEKYPERIRLLDEMLAANQVMQPAGVSLGVQFVQQAQGGPPVSQNALNSLIIQRVNDNIMLRQELGDKVQREAVEIAQLRSTVDELTIKDTAMSSSIRMLREELDQKEEKIKRMERKIKELETERDELEEKLSKIKKDVRSLKSENRELHDAVHNLEEQNKIMNNSIATQQTQMGEMMSMMKELTEQYRKEKEDGEVNKEKKALISLGQAATNFVNKVFEMVHPTLYKRDLIYTLRDIENHISSNKYKSEEKLDSAKKRWDDIRQKIEAGAPQWQDTLSHLKRQRNHVAHPDVQPEEALSCLTLLHNSQSLNDDIYQEMRCIIEKWQAM